MKHAIFLLLLYSISLYAMDVEKGKELTVYAIPGQNGAGSNEYYVKNVIKNENMPIITVETPKIFPDLGQSHCISYLDKAIKKEGKEGIIYATSQGTATALNYVAHNDKERKIKALVLEAIMGSGNSAAHHTITGSRGGFFSYYWLPYLAKIQFPRYSPWGRQAVNSIKHIPNDLPVVIIHSKQDTQLSYDDACALYYGLRTQGNDNVYFLSNDGCDHLHILYWNEPKKDIVRAILRKHNILPPNHRLIESDLDEFQPKPDAFKPCYEALIAKEKKHKYLGGALGLGILGSCAYYLMKKFANQYSFDVLKKYLMRT